MKLIFCLPGQSFSRAWLTCWNRTIKWLYDKGISYDVSSNYTPVIYNCRNWLLGGIGAPPRDFKPFNGKIKYDWIIWIDSDSIWEPEDLERLISNPEHKIVTGFYIQYNNQIYAQAIQGENNTMLWLPRDKVDTKGERFELIATGMGFMGVQAGVIEALDFPWFRPVLFGDDKKQSFLSEDTGFCYRIKNLGYQVWGDPKIQIGHEKSWILSGENIQGSKP
jgi:hypothetical protein